ncbi:MAG: hypothetical protein IKZ25_04070 [Clostridia bacterium]|nr:hypothetical protein [Clostridia bacterium]
MKFPKYSSFAQKERTVLLSKFRGVDFSSNYEEIDFSHSPDCKNMYLDENNNLVKRPGFEVIHEFSGSSNGIFTFPRSEGTEIILHMGTKLYRYFNGELEEIFDGLNGFPTKGFVFENKLYILGGNCYIEYDGKRACDVRDIAYTPTTFIGRSPYGGGTRLEYPNLLRDNRINTFIADGVNVLYKTDSMFLNKINKIVVNGRILSEEEYDIVNDGMVQFKTPPEKAEEGIDNVIIDFNCSMEDSSFDVAKCDTFGIFGGKNDGRVFFTGIRGFENVDFQSGLYDATYFPSSGYTKLGAHTTKIMGYVKGDNCQIIIKSDNDSSATHYRRTFELDGDGNAIFPITEGIEGVGAINKSFVNFGGRPLYLSKEGVISIEGTDVSSRYITKNVSVNINGRLLKEENLESAEMFVCDNKLFLCVNGNAYVADGRYFSSKGFEWFYFSGLNIKKAVHINDDIYFLTKDNRFCKMFKEGNFSDGGKSIEAYWKTPIIEFEPKKYLKNITDVQVGFLKSSEEYTADIFYIDEISRQEILKDIVILRSPCNFNTKTKLFDNEYFQVEINNNKPNENLKIEKILISYQIGKKLI